MSLARRGLFGSLAALIGGCSLARLRAKDARQQGLFVAQALASRGITTIIPEYRLYPRCDFQRSSKTPRKRSTGPAYAFDTTVYPCNGENLAATFSDLLHKRATTRADVLAYIDAP